MWHLWYILFLSVKVYFEKNIVALILLLGDAFDANPKEHEAPNGKFANGIIVRDYKPGQVMQVQVEVTANHKGWFIFKLCPNNDVLQDPTQECFEKLVTL